MSMHKVPLTEVEESGLRLHRLPVGTPSQISDCFRLGVKHGQSDSATEIAELKRQRDELAAVIGKALHWTSVEGVSLFSRYSMVVDTLRAALAHNDTALKEYRDAVITQFVGEFKRHVGGDGEFWLHELEDYVDNLKEKEKHNV